MKISLKKRPDTLAAEVEADLQLCAVKTLLSMLASFMVDFSHRAIVSRGRELCGFWYLKISFVCEPLIILVRLMYSVRCETIHIFRSGGNAFNSNLKYASQVGRFDWVQNCDSKQI